LHPFTPNEMNNLYTNLNHGVLNIGHDQGNHMGHCKPSFNLAHPNMGHFCNNMYSPIYPINHFHEQTNYCDSHYAPPCLCKNSNYFSNISNSCMNRTSCFHHLPEQCNLNPSFPACLNQYSNCCHNPISPMYLPCQNVPPYMNFPPLNHCCRPISHLSHHTPGYLPVPQGYITNYNESQQNIPDPTLINNQYSQPNLVQPLPYYPQTIPQTANQHTNYLPKVEVPNYPTTQTPNQFEENYMDQRRGKQPEISSQFSSHNAYQSKMMMDSLSVEEQLKKLSLNPPKYEEPADNWMSNVKEPAPLINEMENEMKMWSKPIENETKMEEKIKSDYNYDMDSRNLSNMKYNSRGREDYTRGAPNRYMNKRGGDQFNTRGNMNLNSGRNYNDDKKLPSRGTFNKIDNDRKQPNRTFNTKPKMPNDDAYTYSKQYDQMYNQSNDFNSYNNPVQYNNNANFNKVDENIDDDIRSWANVNKQKLPEPSKYGTNLEETGVDDEIRNWAKQNTTVPYNQEEKQVSLQYDNVDDEIRAMLANQNSSA